MLIAIRMKKSGFYESGEFKSILNIPIKSLDIIAELTFEGKDKNEYLRSFEHKSVQALIIKLADRICNVQDFKLVGDHTYASKYLHKADCLIEIAERRRDEIGSMWGEITNQQIREEWNSL